MDYKDIGFSGEMRYFPQTGDKHEHFWCYTLRSEDNTSLHVWEWHGLLVLIALLRI